MNIANTQTRIQLLLYLRDEAKEHERMYKHRRYALSQEIIKLEMRLNDVRNH